VNLNLPFTGVSDIPKPTRVLAIEPKTDLRRNTQMKSFQFTVFAAENGYRIRVKTW
jgi:hypothetical protein